MPLEGTAMSSAAMLLAATLLTSPLDAPEPLPHPDDWPALREALQTLAVESEILDPRETRHMFAPHEDFPENLMEARKRYQELRDAPRLSDCNRFPDRGTVNDLLAFNRAYRRHLDARQPLEQDRSFELQTALKETDYLYGVWDCVRDARCDYYYVAVRRRALKKLRTTLGTDDYYSAKLPPFVPLWRFEDN